MDLVSINKQTLRISTLSCLRRIYQRFNSISDKQKGNSNLWKMLMLEGLLFTKLKTIIISKVFFINNLSKGNDTLSKFFFIS